MEFLFELIVQLFCEVIVEASFHKLSGIPWARRALNTALALVVYFGLGGITGWASTLIFPQSFIRSSKLHGISLLITPLLAGLVMWGIGWLRRRQGRPVLRLDTFGYGFIFAFGMALARFLFTT